MHASVTPGDSRPLGPRGRAWHWACVIVALVLLNGAVTFHNVWPTLGVHWPGELSVELAALLLLLALSNAWVGPNVAAPAGRAVCARRGVRARPLLRRDRPRALRTRGQSLLGRPAFGLGRGDVRARGLLLGGRGSLWSDAADSRAHVSSGALVTAADR